MSHLLAAQIPAGAYYLDWTLALSFSAIGVFSPMAIAIWRRSRKRSQKIDALYEAFLGKQPTLDQPTPAAGIIERLENLEAAVAAVKKEVTPNGGKSQSIGDRVRRIEDAINAQGQ